MLIIKAICSRRRRRFSDVFDKSARTPTVVMANCHLSQDLLVCRLRANPHSSLLLPSSLHSTQSRGALCWLAFSPRTSFKRSHRVLAIFKIKNKRDICKFATSTDTQVIVPKEFLSLCKDVQIFRTPGFCRWWECPLPRDHEISQILLWRIRIKQCDSSTPVKTYIFSFKCFTSIIKPTSTFQDIHPALVVRPEPGKNLASAW